MKFSEIAMLKQLADFFVPFSEITMLIFEAIGRLHIYNFKFNDRLCFRNVLQHHQADIY